MRKNIEKPKLNAEDKAILAAQIKTMFIITIRSTKGMNRKYKKLAKRVQTKITEEILFGDWENALLIAMENKGFTEAFRKILQMLLDGGVKPLEKRQISTEEAQGVMLSTMKFRKVYEYMTGNDFETGKKIHKGVVDAD